MSAQFEQNFDFFGDGASLPVTEIEPGLAPII